MLANDVSTRIDTPRAKSDRLHACRDKWQLAATDLYFAGGRGNSVEVVGSPSTHSSSSEEAKFKGVGHLLLAVEIQ